MSPLSELRAEAHVVMVWVTTWAYVASAYADARTEAERARAIVSVRVARVMIRASVRAYARCLWRHALGAGLFRRRRGEPGAPPAIDW